MKISLQQAAVFAFGLLLGAVAAVWLLRAPYLSLRSNRLQLGTAALPAPGVAPRQSAASAPVPTPKTLAALPPPASCPSQAVTTVAGDKDGRFVLQSSMGSKTATDIPSFILAGKEAAAAGRGRDAEVAFLMSCRVADALRGSDSVESADARYQLGRHYAMLAQEAGPAPRTNRMELLRRAETMYSDSLATYQVKYGAGHEKTRFAAEGLASALQIASSSAATAKAAPAGPAPAPTPAPAVVAAAPAAVAVPKPAPPESRPQLAAAPNAVLPPQPQLQPQPQRERPTAALPVEPPRQAVVTPAAPPRQVAVAPAPSSRDISAIPSVPSRQVMAAAPEAPRIAPPRPVAPAPVPRRIEAAIVEAPLRQATGDATFPSPSFDCSRARSRSEKIICSDAELARLDRDLGRLHARARTSSPDPVSFRRQNDQEWRNRESICRDRECLVQWYMHRRQQLLGDIDQTAGRNQPTIYRRSR